MCSASKGQILQELATCIKGAIDADNFSLYLTSEAHQDLYKYEKNFSEEELPYVITEYHNKIGVQSLAF